MLHARLSAQAEGAEINRPDRPNFLWLTCEDMSPNLGCYGDPDAVTPNLDRLAARGVRYTLAFAPAGVCATARSSLIVGMYASSIGSQHMRCTTTLPDFIRPFTTYLRRAGYYCTNQSKQDYNFKTPADAWDVGRGPKAHWKYRKPGQPFFAVFNYVDTHESRIRGPTRVKVPLTEAERHDPAKVHVPPYLPDTPLIRKDWARYLDLITMMDKAWIPQRLKELEEAGVADNTIIFFFSDHGVGLPRAKQFVYEAGLQVPLIIYFPPRWRHLAPAKPGSAVDRLVSFVDFGPTILSLAGIPIPKHMQGKPFLGPQAVPPREYVFGIRDRMDERYDMTRTVRDRRFKYHRHYMPFIPHYPWLDYMEQLDTAKELRRLKAEGKLTDGPAFFMADSKPPEELYDLQVDPHELHNVADDPRYREVLERMRRVHGCARRSTPDSCPSKSCGIGRRVRPSTSMPAVASIRWNVCSRPPCWWTAAWTPCRNS
ncbi:MAG: sulfatase [Planctomycetes bacterium]|nr:sulfatase [Planctomycetota bacterium]